MTLPQALSRAGRAGRLLVLWGSPGWPLAERPAADRLPAGAGEPAPHPELVAGLPPLPILSLDPSQRLERAFAAAGVPLRVVRGRQDVPAQGRHSLLKLAGDLQTRRGVVLSRAGVRELRGDPDKRHLLDEASRVAAADGGALLLLGCDPADEDFRAWWAVLAPVFRGAAWYAVGEPSAPWPEGVACLGPDLAAVSAALWAAQPPAEPGPLPEPAPTGTAGTVYHIHSEGGAVVIGGVQVEGGDFVGRDSQAGQEPPRRGGAAGSLRRAI